MVAQEGGHCQQEAFQALIRIFPKCLHHQTILVFCGHMQYDWNVVRAFSGPSNVIFYRYFHRWQNMVLLTLGPAIGEPDTLCLNLVELKPRLLGFPMWAVG